MDVACEKANPLLPRLKSGSEYRLQRSQYDRQVRRDFSAAKIDKMGAAIVYTMGKVGGQTVHQALLDSLTIPVYHLHRISEQSIRHQLKWDRLIWPHARYMCHQLAESKLIRKYMQERGVGPNLKFVTMVRDPIARDLSLFFQIADFAPEVRAALQISDDDMRVESLIRIFLEAIEDPQKYIWRHEYGDFALNWFDTEVKQALGFDIYRHGFDRDQPCKSYITSGTHLMVMKTDFIDQCLPLHLAEFPRKSNRLTARSWCAGAGLPTTLASDC